MRVGERKEEEVMRDEGNGPEDGWSAWGFAGGLLRGRDETRKSDPSVEDPGQPDVNR